MSAITTTFQQAQLSAAAYANFFVGANNLVATVEELSEIRGQFTYLMISKADIQARPWNV